eukprot:Plantae.Rhodophyta-Purpureofilum_apyrenoidigerum.ctg3396.p1 GENE.Plantae.Rhodophyta-Purpureofilum_apyrenoidigerum.ctg3396~~Plantae.Rhodophyta-Purpureofilum_apyrenoidigerum.ctg3396.p1  ORF type:complete len:198 (-),score=36.06 Plantae.Rhodophyta-Purpureofilum_apyrenoidigerum.ctg3396:425-1018(-)
MRSATRDILAVNVQQLLERAADTISIDLPTVRLENNMKLAAVLAVCILDFLLILACAVTVFYVVRGRKRRQQQQMVMAAELSAARTSFGEESQCAYHKRQMMVMKQVDYVKDNCVVEGFNLEDNEEREPCPICFDVLGVESPRRVLKLTCSHYFHEVCMTHWIIESHGTASCPLCKSSILSDEDISCDGEPEMEELV